MNNIFYLIWFSCIICCITANISCPPGEYIIHINNETYTCEKCPEGHYSDTYNSTSCKLCQPGSYADVIGSINCTSCVPGTYANVTGSTNCTSCKPGSYADQSNSTKCKSCPPNYVNNGSGKSACLPCLIGEDQRESGKTNCVKCQQGFYNSISGDYCKQCQMGYYQTLMGSANCIQCPAGYYCPNAESPPKKCPHDCYCPSSSVTPSPCRTMFVPHNNKECIPSTALIVLICSSIIVAIFICFGILKSYKANKIMSVYVSPASKLSEESVLIRKKNNTIYSGY